MSPWRKLRLLIENPFQLWIFFANRGFFNYMDDEKYLRYRYRCLMRKKLSLERPRSFNEKIQWLKLYDRKPIYNSMVDKYEAKNYVGDLIGEQYIIPTYGVWNNFDEIDFDSLPDQFVIKCTHDSGGIVIVRDKNKFDKEHAKKVIERALNKDFYLIGREWPYKDLEHRIIIEKYISNRDNDLGLIDYKFYCFNGEPKFLYISAGLEDHDKARISFVSLEWERLPFYRTDFKQFEQLPEKPTNYEEMIHICKKLAEGIRFIRVDLYEIDNRIYFSELTFHPCSGFMPLNDEKYDLEIGEMLELSK
ncbi:glycosyl transferase [Butyrivibrio proteoclasticus B316]|uniref:Glycosyl transferase n=2 Tax=Butyrivibrio proteoclasticus TaxID=43305 RepID=E0S0Y5_BUTPB|nr:glycosyl transferase [Butyrivibrio proteoclasticus B316]